MLGCKTLNSAEIPAFSCHSLQKWHSSSRHQPPTKKTKRAPKKKKKGRQKKLHPFYFTPRSLALEAFREVFARFQEVLQAGVGTLHFPFPVPRSVFIVCRPWGSFSYEVDSSMGTLCGCIRFWGVKVSVRLLLIRDSSVIRLLPKEAHFQSPFSSLK